MPDSQILPANEAYRDNTQKELDHRVLIDMFGLPESILEPLDLLRLKWYSEPSVHGGKKTAPEGRGGLLVGRSLRSGLDPAALRQAQGERMGVRHEAISVWQAAFPHHLPRIKSGADSEEDGAGDPR